MEDEYADFESASDTLAHARVIDARLDRAVQLFRTQFILPILVSISLLYGTLLFIIFPAGSKFTDIFGIPAELKSSLGLICLFVAVKTIASALQAQTTLKELRRLQRLHNQAICSAAESLE